ncbi:MAG: hypothetical protein H0X02_07620 [Nitrosomonas sp.]|nr:hypothetical protein [Nitrosomonas sp.]
MNLTHNLRTAFAAKTSIKPRNINIPNLWEEDQKDLIENIAQSVTQYQTKNVIDCLSSGIELHLENTPDFLREYKKDQELIVRVLDAVSKFSVNLTQDDKTEIGCRQIRRRARDQFLIAIGDIEVVS